MFSTWDGCIGVYLFYILCYLEVNVALVLKYTNKMANILISLVVIIEKVKNKSES